MTQIDQTPLISAREIAIDAVDIESGVKLNLPKSVPLTNLADTNPEFARHMTRDIYVDRTAAVDPISLLRLPPGVLVYGGGHFITEFDGKFVSEQYPPYVGSIIKDLDTITKPPRETVEVVGEMILIARYGIATWGHWLGELLPKILLLEEKHPRRFKYVLPVAVFEPATRNQFWSSIQESLADCGIGLNRIVPIENTANYLFTSLYLVSSVWSDHVIHPAASAALRRATSYIDASAARHIAVVRDPRSARHLTNFGQIFNLLQHYGFTLCESYRMTFREQVAMFKGANVVFSVLGSDLTNIIFSPEGLKLISAAPDVFGDRFFYALLLDRHGTMADLRGPVTDPHAVQHKGSFSVDLGVIGSGLRALSLA